MVKGFNVAWEVPGQKVTEGGRNSQRMAAKRSRATKLSGARMLKLRFQM